jgi:hypothetical protein
MADENTIGTFLARLVATGMDYLPDSRLPGKLAAIRFAGSLAGKRIIWDARIQAQGRHSTAPQFIEVADEGYPLRRVSIGLNVEVIDRQVVERTIIMMRKYKRLRVGRHEFGGAGRQPGGP